MGKPPVLRDWKSLVEKEINSVGHGKDDILKVVYLCQDLQEEIRPASQWVSEHLRYVDRIMAQFREMYFIRFGQELPSRPKEEVSEMPLDTPEHRKQAVREVALAMTKPGDEISDETILEELRCRGMRLVADNPTATISTILNGFKTEFEKVKEKRGVFRRIVR